MLYEISYVANGSEGKSSIRANSDEQALELFRQQWGRYGDPLPTSFWVSARWSQSL